MTVLRSRAGRLVFAGEAGLLAALSDELESAVLGRRTERGFRTLGAARVFLKQGPLRGKHRLRHGLRRAFGVSELPRLAEFANLAWLREHGFGAPRPLLAGAYFRRGLPHHQFLLTEAVSAAPTLRELLEHGPRELRAHALDALAHDLARLHALGFVHRDLFPRNVLVQALEHGARIVFLDAWRGGPGRDLRGPAHDLGCFFLEGARWLDPHEQARFLGEYRLESCRLGRDLLAERLRQRVRAARRRVWRREQPRRSESFPAVWDPPRLP